MAWQTKFPPERSLPWHTADSVEMPQASVRQGPTQDSPLTRRSVLGMARLPAIPQLALARAITMSTEAYLE